MIWNEPVTGQFLEHIKDDKPSAYKLYSFTLKKYVEWLKKKHNVDKNVDELTLEDLKPSWIEAFLSRYSNSYTFNSYLSAFRSLAKFVQKEFMPHTFEEFVYLFRFVNAIELITSRETPKYFSKEALTLEELERLLEETEEDFVMYTATVVHFYFGARPIELAQNYVEVEIDLNRLSLLIKEHGRAMVDFDNKIVCMPIAKSRTRVKVLPFDPIEPYFRNWLKSIDSVLDYAGGKPNEWYTKHIKKYAKRAGIYVTAKTARKTFETLMRQRGVEQWIIDYMLGHKTTIPDVYTDYNTLMPFLREVIKEKHFILELI